MEVATLKNKTKTKFFPHGQRGQAMAEYIIVCALMAMVLIVPFEGKRLYVWVIDALRLMHRGYMAGLSVYAYPF
jgi:hypothetical protein